MVSSLFPPRLRGQIAKALGSSPQITQSDLDILWTSFGHGPPPTGNKPSKANALVRSVSEGLDADNRFIEMLNDVFYFSAESEQRRNHAESFKPLLVALLNKHFIIDDDEGIQEPAGRILIGSSHATAKSTPVPTVEAIPVHTSKSRTSMEKIGDGRSVFIVHGRNTQARNELAKYLKHLDAKPITWTQAAGYTGKSTPTTMEIINAGMARAQAIVVLFTPDDEARLKSKFVQPEDGTHETELTGQARQNVILEAGMALGAAPDRTVLVRLGKTRQISDIEGINWVDLGDDWDHRERLRIALLNANVTLDPHGDLSAPEAGSFSGIDLG